MPTRLRTLAIAAAASLALAAGCGDDDDTDTGTDAGVTTTEAGSDDMTDDDMTDDDMTDDDMTDDDMTAEGDVLEVADAEGDLTTFLGAVEAAGIMDGFGGPGPFTVFAPTDEAFEAYLEDAGMSRDEVFADPAALRRLLEHHVVGADDPSDMVMAMDGQAFATLAGTEIDVAVGDDDSVTVGGATILRYDLEATNGVVHVIDAVLIPPAG